MIFDADGTLMQDLAGISQEFCSGLVTIAQ
jgi:hypothetical protein